jgi:hypothetical protein
MKERRGTVGRLAGLAEGVAAGARRRQRERAPRVTVYDAEGEPRLLASADPAYEAIVSAAEQMLDLAAGVPPVSVAGESPAASSSTGGVSVPATDSESNRRAASRGGKRDKG